MAVTQSQIDRIIALAKSYGVTRLILFGSAVEEPEEASDIDIACDGVSGWKIYEMAAKIEDELDIPIDIVPLTPSNKLTKYIESIGKVLI